jgi:hypothetical protein
MTAPEPQEWGTKVTDANSHRWLLVYTDGIHQSPWMCVLAGGGHFFGAWASVPQPVTLGWGVAA